jgi:hypothetical protein
MISAATAAIVATTLLNAVPAQANEQASAGIATDVARSHELGQVMERLEPYVSRSTVDGTFALSAPPRMIEKIEPEAYSSVVEGMSRVNEMISAGLLVSTESLQAFPVTASSSGHEGAIDAGVLNHGVNSFSCNWVYCTLKLNAFWTGKLIDALNAGASAAGLAAVLAAAGVFTSPGAVPSAVTAGILVLGAGVIKLCSNSHGVWIRFGLGSWCGGQ